MNKKYIFPNSFHFGIGDADLQVISEAQTLKKENSLPTTWTSFAKRSDKVFQNQTPLSGVDRYSMWEEDAEIIKNLGVKHYRTSVSMSRLLKADMSVNYSAVKWYKNYFSKLKSNGISVCATLYHWEIPEILNKIGGWTNPEILNWCKAHALAVYENLNDYIDDYIVFNEPWCASMKSYWFGEHAPGEKSLKTALKAAHYQLLASSLMVKTLLSKDSSLKIGISFNDESVYAFSTKEEDILAAKRYDGFFNRWFKDPIFKGEYPKDMLEVYKDYLDIPNIKEEVKEMQVGNLLDFFGFNYYCGNVIKHSDNHNNPLNFETIQHPEGQKNGLGWSITIPPVYSDGFYDSLLETYNSYKDYGLKNIKITENGMALESVLKENRINDKERIEYYKEHLRQVIKAIEKGVPISHYYVWTLLDNYEWEEGYKPNSCFGMVYVDREDLKRYPKDSYYWYQNLIKTRQL